MDIVDDFKLRKNLLNMELDHEDVPILVDTTSQVAASIALQTKPLDPEKTRVPITIVTGKVFQLFPWHSCYLPHTRISWSWQDYALELYPQGAARKEDCCYIEWLVNNHSMNRKTT